MKPLESFRPSLCSARAEHKFAHYGFGKFAGIAEACESSRGSTASQCTRAELEIFSHQIQRLEKTSDFFEDEAVGEVAIGLALLCKTTSNENNNRWWGRTGTASCGF